MLPALRCMLSCLRLCHVVSFTGFSLTIATNVFNSLACLAMPRSVGSDGGILPVLSYIVRKSTALGLARIPRLLVDCTSRKGPQYAKTTMSAHVPKVPHCTRLFARFGQTEPEPEFRFTNIQVQVNETPCALRLASILLSGPADRIARCFAQLNGCKSAFSRFSV